MYLEVLKWHVVVVCCVYRNVLTWLVAGALGSRLVVGRQGSGLK